MADESPTLGKRLNETGGALSDQGGLFATMLQAAGQYGMFNPDIPMNVATGANTVGNHIGGPMSVISMITGFNSMMDDQAATDDRVVGAGNVLTGGIGTAGYLANLFGANSGFLGGLANVGGSGIGLGADAFAAGTWGVGGGAAGAGTALATGGAVLGAGLAGYGIGKYGDSKSAEYGIFGEDEFTGKNRSGSDWAADNGVAADRWVDEATGIDWLGDVAGVGTVLGSSVAAMPGVVGSAMYGLGEGAVSLVGDLFSW